MDGKMNAYYKKVCKTTAKVHKAVFFENVVENVNLLILILKVQPCKDTFL